MANEIGAPISRSSFRHTVYPAAATTITMTPQERVVEIASSSAGARAVTLPNSKECAIGDVYTIKLITYDTNSVTIGDLASESNQIVDVVLNNSNEQASFICTAFGWSLLSNTYA